MKIIVNGNPREVPDASDITALLAELKLAPANVAIEINRKLVRTANYSQPLKEGDVVEIVTFVGGG